MKGQPTEWKKMFATDTFHNRLIRKIHKDLTQLNTKKETPQNYSIKNTAQDLSRLFFKEVIQMVDMAKNHKGKHICQ